MPRTCTSPDAWCSRARRPPTPSSSTRSVCGCIWFRVTGSEDELKRLAGRIFSQALDRNRPLWELWLVEGLAGGRFAVLSKTHHALVDGVSGVDIATVLFDSSPAPMPVSQPEGEWIARPLPTKAQLLADALVERSTVPGEVVRG